MAISKYTSNQDIMLWSEKFKRNQTRLSPRQRRAVKRVVREYSLINTNNWSDEQFVQFLIDFHPKRLVK